jgi:hypothetical protein
MCHPFGRIIHSTYLDCEQRARCNQFSALMHHPTGSGSAFLRSLVSASLSSVRQAACAAPAAARHTHGEARMPNQKWAEAPLPEPDEERAAPLLESLSWARIYVGSREALIAAGLVIQGQFPGDPGRARKTQHYRGPPDWRIDRRGPNRFSVRLPRSIVRAYPAPASYDAPSPAVGSEVAEEPVA